MLDVQLSAEVGPLGISALCKLNSLQEFLFCESLDRSRHFIWWCMELMPQLHALGYKPVTIRDDHLFSYHRMIAKGLAGFAARCTLQLRWLALSHLDNHVPTFVSLPEVRVLSLTDDELDQERPRRRITAWRIPNLIHLDLNPTRPMGLLRAAAFSQT